MAPMASTRRCACVALKAFQDMPGLHASCARAVPLDVHTVLCASWMKIALVRSLKLERYGGNHTCPFARLDLLPRVVSNPINKTTHRTFSRSCFAIYIGAFSHSRARADGERAQRALPYRQSRRCQGDSGFDVSSRGRGAVPQVQRD